MDKHDIGPVVSSSHLAQSLPALSEMEYALTLANNAFHRWAVRAMNAAGETDLSALEVLVLHAVHHREKPKKLADLCLMLGIEDTHNVNYAVKKLGRADLVKEGRIGKEKSVAATSRGAETCARYGAIREALLVRAVADLGIDPEEVSKLSSLLRLMAGQYDQAARAAASF